MIPHHTKFKSEELELDGFEFFPNSDPSFLLSPAVLFVHGWQSSHESALTTTSLLTQQGAVSFSFDLRGHGTSQGNIELYSCAQFLKDVVAAYDHLVALPGVDKKNVCVIGSSFGGYLASILTSLRSVEYLVLRAPADYPEELFENTPVFRLINDPSKRSWLSQKRTPEDSQALMAISKFTGSLLIVQSEKDEVIPDQTIQNYIAAASNVSAISHQIVAGAPHSIKNSVHHQGAVNTIISEWANSTVFQCR